MSGSGGDRSCLREDFDAFKHRRGSLLSGLLWDLPNCPLNRGCKNCVMFVNDQHERLLCSVIKLYVVKEAFQSSSSLLFITNFNLFVNGKTLTDFSTYFKDVIQCSVRCPLDRGF